MRRRNQQQASARPASAKVIAQRICLPKAPGYVADTAATDRTARSAAMRVPRSTRVPPHTVLLRLGCSDAPTQAVPVQAEFRETSSRKEVSQG